MSDVTDADQDDASPPARGRGLKHTIREGHRVAFVVAPRAGAWIETRCFRVHRLQMCVAPRAGAWIETVPTGRNARQSRRRPPRGGVD